MATGDGSGQAGARILIVEDEFLVADHIAMSLEDLGYAVIGPVATVAEALGLVADEPLDGVVLDANLDGVSSAPVAAELATRGVPFVVVTGYGQLDLPSRQLNDAPRVTKPYRIAELDRALAAVLQA
jgi:DNA-binding response OmpR family regulator